MTRFATAFGTTARLAAALVCALAVPFLIQTQPVLGPMFHG